jgi:hypothetical protein
MTDIEIPFGDSNKDNAVLLLAAAEELGEDASVVRTTDSAFVVSEELAKKAGFNDEGEQKKAPAKKSSAKKK